MKFEISDIRQMVCECIKKIVLEYHGAINDSILKIAETIITSLRNGKTEFTLNKNNIEQYYPYKYCPNILNVKIENLNNKQIAIYSTKTKTIKISPLFISFNDNYLIEILMHELTHWVNDNESLGKIVNNNSKIIPQTNKELLIKEILYLFNSSEIQARITQLKWYIKRKQTNNFENVTHLKRMLFLINEIEKENYFEYENYFGEENFGTIIEGLLSQRNYYKYTIDGKERWNNLLSENEFIKTKRAILNNFKKKYKKFKINIDKIIYDSNNQ